MSAKEIKELRTSGKLLEAYQLAKNEFDSSPENVWSKRNLSWVLYDLLKTSISNNDLKKTIDLLNEIKETNNPIDETIFYESISWTLGKYIFSFYRTNDFKNISQSQRDSAIIQIVPVIDAIQTFPLPKKCVSYSFVYKAFHKVLKDSFHYVRFADWWNFENFILQDYSKEKLPDGKEIMSIAEQAYICYAKHLLLDRNNHTESDYKERISAYLSILDNVILDHPEYIYVEYYKVKLLLALGDKDSGLLVLLPFAKKKRNDFWVWDLLSEVCSNDKEKVIACYCKALSCKISDDFLIGIRQKLSGYLISEKLLDEAKTEISFLIKTRQNNGWKIPQEVQNWIAQKWFPDATQKKSNHDYYKKYLEIAEAILFSDVSTEQIIIENLNEEKGIAYYFALHDKFGYFKYSSFFKRISIGDVLKVRFQANSKNGFDQLYTLEKIADRDFQTKFIKEIKGIVKIPLGKSFGFVENVFISPAIVKKYSLSNGLAISGQAIRSCNYEKNVLSWKILKIFE